MITLDRIIILVVLIWVFIYTASYGQWTWRKKNKLGAIMLYMLALASLILPLYSIFLREV